MAIKPRVNLQNLMQVLTKQSFRDLTQIQNTDLSVTLKCTQEFVLVMFQSYSALDMNSHCRYL